MMKPSLSNLLLSTMWMQNRFADLASFADASRALGFGGIEVSHIVTPAMIGNADVARLDIGAVHFPAPSLPSPFGKAADALLTSGDETARAWALAQGFATIDFAARSGARTVCLHLGEVPGPHHLEWAICQRYLGGQADQEVYRLARQTLIELRQASAPAALTNALRSLEALAAYAQPRGIRLGIESRVSCWQIPSWEELGQLLDSSDPEVVGFWYDCGHVQVLHNLGFHHHPAWLESYATRIVGAHFHDVMGLRDHLLPGQGELDFARLAAFLPPNATRTCEFDWYFDAEEVVQGARHLIANGIGHL